MSSLYLPGHLDRFPKQASGLLGRPSLEKLEELALHVGTKVQLINITRKEKDVHIWGILVLTASARVEKENLAYIYTLAARDKCRKSREAKSVQQLGDFVVKLKTSRVTHSRRFPQKRFSHIPLFVFIPFDLMLVRLLPFPSSAVQRQWYVSSRLCLTALWKNCELV